MKTGFLVFLGCLAAALFAPAAEAASGDSAATCPEGERLVYLRGDPNRPLCVPERDLKRPKKKSKGKHTRSAPIICFYDDVQGTPFWDDYQLEWYCIYGPLHYRPPGDVLGSPTPAPPEFVHYVGRCRQRLGGIVQWGIIRHDDVAGVKRDDEDEIVEDWRAGFYPVSMWQATQDTACPPNYLTGEPECVYVAGYTNHKSTAGPCRRNLPRVDKARYNTVKTRVSTEGWTDYHLLRQNCHDWASWILR